MSETKEQIAARLHSKYLTGPVVGVRDVVIEAYDAGYLAGCSPCEATLVEAIQAKIREIRSELPEPQPSEEDVKAAKDWLAKPNVRTKDESLAVAFMNHRLAAKESK